jgi:hypothetical protein
MWRIAGVGEEDAISITCVGRDRMIGRLASLPDRMPSVAIGAGMPAPALLRLQPPDDRFSVSPAFGPRRPIIQIAARGETSLIRISFSKYQNQQEVERPDRYDSVTAFKILRTPGFLGCLSENTSSIAYSSASQFQTETDLQTLLQSIFLRMYFDIFFAR